MSEAKQQKIAVVDDDYAVRDSLRYLLEVMGYLVETFEFSQPNFWIPTYEIWRA